ncbi:hypothetical protein [Natronorubrum halophilum]|uniref:hypothetical protein n=1 Tax=Natronorubrum halophilum TaxID=1702106 RepID=UPI000EF7418D|nr:hypothetical protein [Natronorubrum halophilum]
MTWSGLFLGVFAFATVMTLLFAVYEDAVVFSSAMSTVCWIYLAFVPEIVVISDGTDVPVQIGPVRWLFAGIAILSALALLGSMMGWYPAEEAPEASREGMIS